MGVGVGVGVLIGVGFGVGVGDGVRQAALHSDGEFPLQIQLL